MKRCVFLTMDRTDGWVMDDELAVPHLRDRGWSVTHLPWRNARALGTPTGGDPDAVVVRSTWDYHRDLPAFLRTVEFLAASGIALVNDPRWIRWNARKSYLGQLARAGLPVVPTLEVAHLDDSAVARARGRFGMDDLVAKPLVGASAHGLRRLGVSRVSAPASPLPAPASPLSAPASPPRPRGRDPETPPPEREARAGDSGTPSGPWLLQPFVPAVVQEGEYSLIYLDGAFTHAVLKRPRSGDIRVQEEHGGEIRAVRPLPGQREAAEAVLAAAPGLAGLGSGHTPFQARVDLVRGTGGRARRATTAPATRPGIGAGPGGIPGSAPGAEWWLMELELIEPALYLRMDPGAPGRFAAALARRLDARPGAPRPGPD